MIKLTNLAKKVRVLMATLTVAASMGGLAGPADAFTPVPQGCQGRVTGSTIVEGMHRMTGVSLDLGWLNGHYMGSMVMDIRVPGVKVGQFVVQRAPDACATTEQQTVYVNYRLHGFVNQKPWQFLSSQWLSVKLDRGYEATFAPLEMFPSPSVSNLHVDVDIQWYTASGKYLGRFWMSYNATADYKCPTGFACYLGTDATHGAFIGL